MKTNSGLKIYGLGPVGVHMMVAHIKRHSHKTHVLKVNGPDGEHNIVVKPGHAFDVETELKKILLRPEYSTGLYEGAVQAL